MLWRCLKNGLSWEKEQDRGIQLAERRVQSVPYVENVR